MALAFIENGVITKYPVGTAEVRRKYPSTSFPADLEDADLTSFGVVTVHNTLQPSVDFRTEKIESVPPVFDGQQWNQAWNIVPLSDEEKQKITDSKANGVRAERNQRLANCDWTQIADSPLDADAKLAWQLYRETLRMVPQQAGFPWNVEWPPVPGN